MARPHFRGLSGFTGLFFKVWVSGLGFGVYGSVFLGPGFWLLCLFAKA